MLQAQDAPRFDVDGDLAEVDRLVRAAQPFIIEEGARDAFRAFAESVTMDRFADVFGDRPWRVQSCKRGIFEPEIPFYEQTEEMPFTGFLDRMREPHETQQHYLNLWPGPNMDYAQPLFDELRALGPKIALTNYKNQELRVFWLGGAGTITPLHYDTYARSHGVVHGEKLFMLFPPDFRHLRLLQPYPVRSNTGWYSTVGAGPLDPALFPRLAKTRPVRALCGPGDFLYLPPCWWHHVSIPSKPTISVSATFYPKAAYFYYYHWRLRFSRWLARHPRLLNLSNGKLG